MKTKIALSIIALFLSISVCAQITVSSSTPIQQLGLDELIGPGISTTLIQFTGDTSSIGTFSGTSNIGIDEGIILATGSITLAIGPNDITAASEGGNTSGDTDLDSLSGQSTQDATVIEFDFIPATDSIEMSFVFASEEYPEYVCSDFNDIFAFFLSGPNPDDTAYNKTNIALIPGTNLPIAINSINPGVPGSFYTAGACLSLAYSSLYTDNTGGSTIQYDGFTHEITIYAHVYADSTYHIKFAIADVYDGTYDSGIFIRKNSLKCVGMFTNNQDHTKSKTRVFPNPATDYLTIENNQEVNSIEIISLEGVSKMKLFNTIPNKVDINFLPNGNYFVRITTTKNTEIVPIIISH